MESGFEYKTMYFSAGLPEYAQGTQEAPFTAGISAPDKEETIE